MVEDFLYEFPKCPVCGCTDTIARLAWQSEVEAGRISEQSKDMPVGLQNEAVPLIDPHKPPVLSAGMIVVSYDVCADCGTRYCTRAAKQVGPVRMPPPQQGPKGHPPPPFNDPRFS